MIQMRNITVLECQLVLLEKAYIKLEFKELDGLGKDK